MANLPEVCVLVQSLSDEFQCVWCGRVVHRSCRCRNGFVRKAVGGGKPEVESGAWRVSRRISMGGHENINGSDRGPERAHGVGDC